MRIELVTEGGFAAIPGLARPVVVDTSAADPALRDELTALVNAALAEQRTTLADTPSNFRDARRYRMTIERDSEREVLVASDPALPPAFNKLLQYVKAHGKR